MGTQTARLKSTDPAGPAGAAPHRPGAELFRENPGPGLGLTLTSGQGQEHGAHEHIRPDHRPAAVAAYSMKKSYLDKIVLAGVDLTIAEGEVLALLGPTGP